MGRRSTGRGGWRCSGRAPRLLALQAVAWNIPMQSSFRFQALRLGTLSDLSGPRDRIGVPLGLPTFGFPRWTGAILPVLCSLAGSPAVQGVG